MKELHKVDLESFVAFEGDIEFSNAKVDVYGEEEGQTEAYGEEEYGSADYD